MRDPHDTRSLRQAETFPAARYLLAVVGLAAGIWLAYDFANPCTGQFTDLLGCLTAGYEADQAELADAWGEWCADVEAQYVSSDGRYIHPDYETDYERGCVPGTDMLTLDDVGGLP